MVLLGTLGEKGPWKGQEDGGFISNTFLPWWDVNPLPGDAAKTLNLRGLEATGASELSPGECRGRWRR